MISVIVAVYNGEKFIRKCLDSLLAQTYGDFEVVCVDDASTDNSAAIVGDYAARDGRIKLLRMDENRGQAVARNVGFAHSQGEIIAILDADDWFDPAALQCFADTFAQHTQTDCAVCRCIIVDDDGHEEEYRGDAFDVLPGPEAAYRALTWRIHGYYAARRALYEQYPFDTTCHLYSDDNTTRTHYYISREVRQTEARYYYLQHAASATHKVSTDRILYIRAADSMRQTLRDLHCPDTMLTFYESQRWKIVVDGYYFYYKHRRQLTADERRFCREVIRQGWQGTDTSRLDSHLRRKIGYAPLRHWALFRAEEELYFFLRGLLGKN